MRQAKKIARKKRATRGALEERAEGDIGPLGATVIRNEFYRTGYRTALRLVFLQLAAMIGIVWAMNTIHEVHQPKYKYFTITLDGRLITKIPLGQPSLSNPALMSWVSQAVTQVMTFSFSDYRRRLQDSENLFTKAGWGNFMKAIEGARILEMVRVNQQIVTAIPRGAPILTKQGCVGPGCKPGVAGPARYQWTIQTPITVTYVSGNEKLTENYLITTEVVRVDNLSIASGVAIEQWVAVNF
jgi:intracellular multiplication protein IcmL